tara:strand:- start:2178 stop:2738 length:561 start_codon:yes stop_codon:yes gene_type:complete
MITSELECIFVHIPRTGGSSIEISLGKGLGTLSGNNTLGTFKDKHWSSRRYKKNNPSEWSRFFKFTFVRNPWDKAVSTYEWLRMHKKHPQHTTDGFKDWLFSVKANSNSCRAQSWWLHDDLNFMGRYENFHDDWTYVSNLIGCSAKLPHINKTIRRLEDYHDDETIEFISKLYKNDIDLLGYEYGG